MDGHVPAQPSAADPILPYARTTHSPPSADKPFGTLERTFLDPPMFVPRPTEAKKEDAIAVLARTTGTKPAVLKELARFVFPLVRKRVVQMTRMGRQPSMYSLVVVGNGQGLVGYGEGKAATLPLAIHKATIAAIKNVAYVDRFQSRTIWGAQKMKFGSVKIDMWPAPHG